MALTKMAFDPEDGLRNKVVYPTEPADEDVAREQVQGRFDEIKDYLNNKLTVEAESTFSTKTDLAQASGFHSDLAAWYGNTKQIATCEADEGWNFFGTGGNVADDSVDYKVGSGSKKLTAVTQYDSTILNNVNLNLNTFNDNSDSDTADYITLQIKSDGSYQMGLFFGADATFNEANSAYFLFNVASGWNFIKLPKYGFTFFGTMTSFAVTVQSIMIQNRTGPGVTSFDNIQLIRKDPLADYPNPFQREINGVWTRDFAINSGEWFVGKEFGEIVCRDLLGLDTGSVTTTASLVGQKSYSDFIIHARVKANATKICRYGWQIDSSNRIRLTSNGINYYISSDINGVVDDTTSTPGTILVGDIIDMVFQKNGKTFIATFIKNGDKNNPIVLQKEVSAFENSVGYLAYGGRADTGDNILSLSITTAEHAHHADEAEVAKTLAIKYKAGAFTASELNFGEIGIDTTNHRLYVLETADTVKYASLT